MAETISESVQDNKRIVECQTFSHGGSLQHLFITVDDKIKGVLALANVKSVIFFTHSSILSQTLESVIFGYPKREKREIITKPHEELHV
jgi:hypothetical protein